MACFLCFSLAEFRWCWFNSTDDPSYRCNPILPAHAQISVARGNTQNTKKQQWTIYIRFVKYVTLFLKILSARVMCCANWFHGLECDIPLILNGSSLLVNTLVLLFLYCLVIWSLLEVHITSL